MMGTHHILETEWLQSQSLVKKYNAHQTVPASNLHCKDTMPKIRNKYSQKKNELYIFPQSGLSILLQENMCMTDPGIIL